MRRIAVNHFAGGIITGAVFFIRTHQRESEMVQPFPRDGKRHFASVAFDHRTLRFGDVRFIEENVIVAARESHGGDGHDNMQKKL